MTSSHIMKINENKKIFIPYIHLIVGKITFWQWFNTNVQKKLNKFFIITNTKSNDREKKIIEKQHLFIHKYYQNNTFPNLNLNRNSSTRMWILYASNFTWLEVRMVNFNGQYRILKYFIYKNSTIWLYRIKAF